MLTQRQYAVLQKATKTFQLVYGFVPTINNIIVRETICVYHRCILWL